MYTKNRGKAIGLRQLGKTYSEIKAQLRIPKSTLSGWLKDYPLTDKELSKLNKHGKIRLFGLNTFSRKKRQKSYLLIIENYISQGFCCAWVRG
jgi:hypothetical protein